MADFDMSFHFMAEPKRVDVVSIAGKAKRKEMESEYNFCLIDIEMRLHHTMYFFEFYALVWGQTGALLMWWWELYCCSSSSILIKLEEQSFIHSHLLSPV